MLKQYSLPSGWELKKIANISKFVRGITFKPTDKYEILNEKSIPCFRTSNVQTKLDDSDLIYIDKTLVKDKEKIIQHGDILVSSANSLELLGKCCLIENLTYEATLGGFIVCARVDKTIVDYKYFYYFFNSDDNQEIMRSLANKTTGIANLPIKKVEEQTIPLPPLHEQNRLVSLLDTLFAKIDRSIELLEENIAAADAFLPSVLNTVFGELEEQRESVEVGKIIEILTDYHANGSYETLKQHVQLKDGKDFALMVRATDLENNFKTDLKFITETAYNFLEKTKIYGNEIIMPKIGSIGTVYLMPYIDQPCSLAMNIFLIRCNSTLAINQFLYLFLSSPRGKEIILSKANGAVTKTITKDAVRSIKIPLPPLDIQTKTVKYLDSIRHKVETLKRVQNDKIANLKALKASILDRAFKGEL